MSHSKFKYWWRLENDAMWQLLHMAGMCLGHFEDISYIDRICLLSQQLAGRGHVGAEPLHTNSQSGSSWKVSTPLQGFCRWLLIFLRGRVLVSFPSSGYSQSQILFDYTDGGERWCWHSLGSSKLQPPARLPESDLPVSLRVYVCSFQSLCSSAMRMVRMIWLFLPVCIKTMHLCRGLCSHAMVTMAPNSTMTRHEATPKMPLPKDSHTILPSSLLFLFESGGGLDWDGQARTLCLVFTLGDCLSQPHWRVDLVIIANVPWTQQIKQNCRAVKTAQPPGRVTGLFLNKPSTSLYCSNPPICGYHV